MAQKKKDKRQQKINQRRAEKTRERKKKNQSQPKTATHGTTLPKQFRQAAPLLEYINQHSDTTEKRYFITKFVLEGSAELINEPEFTDLLINPLDAMEAMVEVETLYPDQSSSDDEPMSEAEMYIFNQTLSKLLTPDIQTAILSQLKELLERQRNSHNLTKAANIEFLYSLLNKVRDREAWIMTGLIHGIIGQSVKAGNDLMEVTSKLPDITKKDAVNWFKLAKSEEYQQTIDTILTNNPGLTTFVEKQIDEIYKDGLFAVYKGELPLELFTPAELEKSRELWSETMEDTKIKELKQRTYLYMEQITPYIIELATPTRLAEMHTYIEQLIEQPGELDQWRPFLMIAEQNLAASAENNTYFGLLIHGILGQTYRSFVQAQNVLLQS